jgi:hypothetical protein
MTEKRSYQEKLVLRFKQGSNLSQLFTDLAKKNFRSKNAEVLVAMERHLRAEAGEHFSPIVIHQLVKYRKPDEEFFSDGVVVGFDAVNGKVMALIQDLIEEDRKAIPLGEDLIKPVMI